MRNTGLKNSNYCMTVVGVAPPLYVTRKIYTAFSTVYNGAEELLRTFCWHSGSWDYSLDGWTYDQLTTCNQGSWRSRVKLSTWTGVVCYFIDLVQPCIECELEDDRQAFDHENHTTRYI